MLRKTLMLLALTGGLAINQSVLAQQGDFALIEQNLDEAGFDSDSLSIDLENGVAYIAGNVAPADVNRILEIVAATEGVTQVVSELNQ